MFITRAKKHHQQQQHRHRHHHHHRQKHVMGCLSLNGGYEPHVQKPLSFMGILSLVGRVTFEIRDESAVHVAGFATSPQSMIFGSQRRSERSNPIGLVGPVKHWPEQRRN